MSTHPDVQVGLNRYSPEDFAQFKPDPEPAPTSAQARERFESRLQIMLQAKDRLPEDLQSLFHSMFVVSKPNAQIAQEMGITPEVLASRLRGMMSILRTASA